MTIQKPTQSDPLNNKTFHSSRKVKHYKYIHIWSSSDEIRVQCTDSQTIQVLIRAIKRTYPDSHIESRDDLTDQVYIVKISGLEPEDRHNQIAWWLFKMLCEQGWEPMETGDHWYKMKTV
jgi:hypothetical protein